MQSEVMLGEKTKFQRENDLSLCPCMSTLGFSTVVLDSTQIERLLDKCFQLEIHPRLVPLFSSWGELGNLTRESSVVLSLAMCNEQT